MHHWAQIVHIEMNHHPSMEETKGEGENTKKTDTHSYLLRWIGSNRTVDGDLPEELRAETGPHGSPLAVLIPA